MDTPAWIMPLVFLAAAGFCFLRLLSMGREAALWQAQVEAERAADAERLRRRRQAEATTRLSDVELV